MRQRRVAHVGCATRRSPTRGVAPFTRRRPAAVEDRLEPASRVHERSCAPASVELRRSGRSMDSFRSRRRCAARALPLMLPDTLRLGDGQALALTWVAPVKPHHRRSAFTALLIVAAIGSKAADCTSRGSCASFVRHAPDPRAQTWLTSSLLHPLKGGASPNPRAVQQPRGGSMTRVPWGKPSTVGPRARRAAMSNPLRQGVEAQRRFRTVRRAAALASGATAPTAIPLVGFGR